MKTKTESGVMTVRDRVAGWYFAVSLCAICSAEEVPWWMLLLLTANFANAARLANRVEFTENGGIDDGHE